MDHLRSFECLVHVKVFGLSRGKLAVEAFPWFILDMRKGQRHIDCTIRKQRSCVCLVMLYLRNQRIGTKSQKGSQLKVRVVIVSWFISSLKQQLLLKGLHRWM